MGDPYIGGRVGITFGDTQTFNATQEYYDRRRDTLVYGRRTMADIYERAAEWCDKYGSNLDIFTALDVVGYPVWDGLVYAKTLEDILWSCGGSKYLMSKAERATLLCMAAAVERQGW